MRKKPGLLYLVQIRCLLLRFRSIDFGTFVQMPFQNFSSYPTRAEVGREQSFRHLNLATLLLTAPTEEIRKGRGPFTQSMAAVLRSEIPSSISKIGMRHPLPAERRDGDNRPRPLATPAANMGPTTAPIKDTSSSFPCRLVL